MLYFIVYQKKKKKIVLFLLIFKRINIYSLLFFANNKYVRVRNKYYLINVC